MANSNHEAIAAAARRHANGEIGAGELIDFCRARCLEVVAITSDALQCVPITAQETADPFNFPEHFFIQY